MYQLKIDDRMVAESSQKFIQTYLKKYGDQPVWISGCKEIAGLKNATQVWAGEDPCPDPDFFPGATPEPDPPIVLTVIEFKMCFTSAERLAIYALRDAGDAVIADWLSILDDPRCTAVDLGLQSTQDAVGYLTSVVDGFDTARAAEVLAGTLL